MISANDLKKFAKKYNKKIGGESAILIETLIKQELEERIKKAARNADFAGRITIKEEDFAIKN